MLSRCGYRRGCDCCEVWWSDQERFGGGNLEGQDVCVFRGLDWEIGKAFGITLSLGSTHTNTHTHTTRYTLCEATDVPWLGGRARKSRPHGTGDRLNNVFGCTSVFVCVCVREYRRVSLKLDKTVFSAVLTSGTSLMRRWYPTEIKKTLALCMCADSPKTLLGQASDTCVCGFVRIYMG